MTYQKWISVEEKTPSDEQDRKSFIVAAKYKGFANKIYRISTVAMWQKPIKSYNLYRGFCVRNEPEDAKEHPRVTHWLDFEIPALPKEVV